MKTDLKTTSFTILLLISASIAVRAPAIPFSLSLIEPEIFPVLTNDANGADQSFGIFGRAMRMSNIERIWIFPRAPFTPVSDYITSIDTSVMPDRSDVEYLTKDPSGSPVDGSPVINTYISIFQGDGSDVIKDIIPLTFPPDHPYVFAGLFNSGAYIFSFNPEDIDVPGFEAFDLEDGKGIDDISVTGMADTKILKIQLRNGMSLVGYASGNSDGPREMNIQFGLDELKTYIGARRRLQFTEGAINWPLTSMIALYEAPGSPFHGQMLLGASPTGEVEMLSLKLIHDASATPASIYDTEMSIVDMAQSSIFYNKVVCAHSGEDNLISILHLGLDGNTAGLHHSIPKISDTMNSMMHRGIIHPYGTAGFMFLVYDSDTSPTSSELHFIYYPVESMTNDIVFQESGISVASGMVTDIMLFPKQGYATLIGTGTNTNSGVTSDFYMKVQVMCHPTCSACKELGADKCTRCQPRYELNATGSSGVGTCELEEEEIDPEEPEIVVADCGGQPVPACVKCEEAQPGFCQMCQNGFGLDEISERGTGQSCEICPVENCKDCELTDSGKNHYL